MQVSGALVVGAPVNWTTDAPIAGRGGNMFVKLESGVVVNIDRITALTQGKVRMACGGELNITTKDREDLLEILIPKPKVTLEALRPEPAHVPPEATQPQGSYRRDRNKPKTVAPLEAPKPETAPSQKEETC